MEGWEVGEELGAEAAVSLTEAGPGAAIPADDCPKLARGHSATIAVDNAIALKLRKLSTLKPMIAFSKLNVFTSARKVIERVALLSHLSSRKGGKGPLRQGPGKNRKIILDFIGSCLATDRSELLN
jgi:hypothetical protein